MTRGTGIPATLSFVLKGDKVLLLKKSKGLFGEEKWNVPGGKIRPGENPENGAIRETLEETGLRVKNLEQVGLVHFYKNMRRDVPEWTGYVFVSREFSGTLTEGREGILKWFSIHDLPFDDMWEDDQYWSRLVFERKKFEAWFYYSGEFEKLIDHRIKRIDSGNNSQTIEARQPR